MTDNDRLEFGKVLMALGEMFDTQISQSRLQGYWESLQGYSLEEVTAAAARLRASERFFPKPVDFIEAIRGTEADRAEQTWNLLLKCIAKGGSWTSFVTSDTPLANTIKELWGTWDELCRVVGREDSHEMVAHWRNRFSLVYRSQLKRVHPLAVSVHYFACASAANNRLTRGMWREDIAFDPNREKCIGLIEGAIWRDLPIQIDPQGRVLIAKREPLRLAGGAN